MSCKVAGNNTTVIRSASNGRLSQTIVERPTDAYINDIIKNSLARSRKMTQIHESQRKQIPDNDKNKPFITILTKVLQPVGS